MPEAAGTAVADLQVVVPHYGRLDHLQAAVRSVLAQDDPRWRLLVVEDGRDHGDAAEAWLATVTDPRVTYRRSPDRLGIPGAFARCLDLARGTHVTFLGADDELLPAYVSTVRALLAAHPGVDVVAAGVRVVDADGRPARTLTDLVKAVLRPRGRAPRRLAGEPLLTSLLLGNWAYFPSLCWRLETVRPLGFRADLPTTLDLALLAEVVLGGGSVVAAAPPVFRYRRHAASASALAAASTSRFAEEARLLDELAARCDARGWPRAARAARLRPTSRAHALLGLGSTLRRDDRAAAGRLLRHVVHP